jgi:RHS repeat-associated protein
LVPGSADTAVSFDYAGPYVDCGYFAPSSSTAGSIEAWVKLDSLPTTAPYVASIAGPESFQLRVLEGKVQFVVGTTGGLKSVTAAASIVVGQIQHLVGVFDGYNLFLYIDGVRAGSWFSNYPLSGGGPFFVGRSSTFPGARDLDGTVDEVATYAGALNQTQARDHFEVGIGGYRVPVSDGYSSAVLADSPSKYWRLGDSSSAPGRPVVASAGAPCRSVGSTGLGAYGLTDTSFDTAASFDPAGPLVDCGAFTASGSAASIEAWVRADSLPTISPYIATVAGIESFQLRIASGKPELVIETSSKKVATSSESLVPGTTYHLVGTFSAGYLRLYVDGVLKGSAFKSGVLSGAGFFWLGSNASYPGARDLDGVVDEVAVYPTQLSDAQVSAHYEAGGSVLAGGPIDPSEARCDGSLSSCADVYDKTRYPVSLPFGEFWHTFESFSFPGRGVPLSLSHSYSSSLATVNGPLGYGWAMSYPSMRLSENTTTGRVTVVEENGTEVTFDPDAANPGEFLPTKRRFIANLVHNGDGTWTFTRRNGGRVFTFSADGLLSELYSEVGDPTARTTFDYDTSDQLEMITDPAGRTLTFTWSSGRIVEVEDSSTPARSVTFAYDTNGNLEEWTDVAGGSWAFTYDSGHRLLTMRDPNQDGVTSPPVITNVYDTAGRVTSQTDREGGVTAFDYTAVPGSVISTDPEGRQELTRYSSNLPLSITNGYGTTSAATTRIIYDRNVGTPAHVQDPNGRWTHMTYDANGNRTATIDPLGRATSAEYNTLGQVTESTDGEGVTTTYTYDGNHNLTSVSTPLVGSSPPASRTVTYTYADTSHPGDVTEITDPRGKSTTLGYDTAGNVDSVTDPEGNETTTSFNSRGWPTATVSPRGNASGGTPADHATGYTYDAHGDVLTVTDPLGDITTFTYDANRNLIAVENPNGHTTTFSYDAEDRPTATVRPDSTSEETDYWADGQVKNQTDGAGGVTSYAYDDLGRFSAVTEPLSNTTNYLYDPAGNLIGSQDPGGNCLATPATGCTIRSYDAANQLTAIDYSDTATPDVTAVTYDDNGRRLQANYGTASSSTWAWDSLGRLTASSDGTAVSYGYDLAGNVTSVVYPGSRTLTRGYDDAGRLVSSTDWNAKATTFGYDEDSNLTTVDFPTGDQTDSVVYDRADRITGIEMTAGATTLAALDYTRDDNGQLTGEDLTSLPGADRTLGYDTLQRLTTQNTATAWAYDGADNLIRTTSGGTTIQAFNAAGQLCTAAPTVGTCAAPATGATGYGYDTRGNRTTVTPPSPAPVTTLSYDQANRLTAVDTAGATYAYNPDGLRTSKTVSSATTSFAWDKTGGLPLLLTETTGTSTTSYLYGPGGTPYAQVAPDGTTTTYLHADQLGSIRLLTDAIGTPTGAATYDAYGAVAASTGTLSPFGYAGQYTDTETGYQYLRARYYDPTNGQFLTRDPISALTREPYAYVAGSPLGATDPSGLCRGSTDGGRTSVCAGRGDMEVVASWRVRIRLAKGWRTRTLRLYCEDVRHIEEKHFGGVVDSGQGSALLAIDNAVRSPSGFTPKYKGGTLQSFNSMGTILAVGLFGAVPLFDTTVAIRNDNDGRGWYIKTAWVDPKPEGQFFQ